MSRGEQQRQRAAGDEGPGGPWSAAWSAHLDRLGEFGGRRERGREYLLAGAVEELVVEPGRISARVQGSRIYRPAIVVQPLAEAVRAGLGELVCAEGCAPRDLLRAALTTPQGGVLPRLRELTAVCTCPDRARPCKHVFAALYAFGRRLDDAPELLFTLRGVALDELVRRRRRGAGVGRASAAVGRVATLRAGPVALQRPAKTVRVASRPLTRAELRALGVAASTIAGWLRQGVLRRTAERGVYRRTAAALRRLAARGVTI